MLYNHERYGKIRQRLSCREMIFQIFTVGFTLFNSIWLLYDIGNRIGKTTGKECYRMLGQWKKRKGVVLVTAMFLLMMVVMVGAMAVVTGKNTLELGTSFRDGELAYRAAESGGAIVQGMLQKNKKWMTTTYSQGQGQARIVEFNPVQKAESGALPGAGDPVDNLVVKYDAVNRCIEGIFYDGKGGEISRFRAAFVDPTKNSGQPQKAPDFSGLDTNGLVKSKLPFYSCINLEGSGALHSYKYIKEEGSSTETPVVFREVPARSAHIVVQGMSGTSSVYFEQMLTAGTLDENSQTSAARGGVDVTLSGSDSVFLVNNSKSETFRSSSIRSLEEIAVTAEGGNAADFFQVLGEDVSAESRGKKYGTVYSENVKLNGTDISKDSSGVSFLLDDSNDQKRTTEDFMDQVRNSIDSPWDKNSSGSDGYANLYCFVADSKEEGVLPTYKVLTVGNIDPADMEAYLDGTKNVSFAGSGEKLTNIQGFKVVGTTLTADRDIALNQGIGFGVFVKNEDGTYTRDTHDRVNVVMEGQDEYGNPPRITVHGGSIGIGGALSGTGTVYAEKDVLFQGRSFFETQPDSGVGVYSHDGDVKVLPSTGTQQMEEERQERLMEAWNDLQSRQSTFNTPDEIAEGLLRAKTQGDTLLNYLMKEEHMNEDNARHLADLIARKNTYLNQDGEGGGMSSLYTPKVDGDSCGTKIYFTKEDGTLSGCFISIEMDGTGNGFHHRFTVTINDNRENVGYGAVKLYGDEQNPGSGWQLKEGSLITLQGIFNEPNLTLSDLKKIMVWDSRSHSKTNLKFENIKEGSFLQGLNLGFDRAGNGVVTFNETETKYSGGPTEESGVSKSSDGKLTLSKGKLITPNANDVMLKGLVYTNHGNFDANLGGGTLTVLGGVVTNQRESFWGSNGDKGKILMKGGRFVNLSYDSRYMQLFQQGISTVAVFRSVFTMI